MSAADGVTADSILAGPESSALPVSSGAGREIDRERFVEPMESIRGWDSGSILPPVSFSNTGHHAQKAGFIAELKNGRFEDLSGWLAPK